LTFEAEQKESSIEAMKKYKHIQKVERKEIAHLKKKGKNIRDIAGILGRGIGTVCDEINRNAVKKTYDPEKANHKAYVRRKYAKYQGMKIVGNDGLREYVEEKVKEDWSPEIIAGRIKFVDTHIPYGSFRCVYKFIKSPYGRKLEQHLWYKGRKWSIKKRPKVTELKNRIFIDKRPKYVEKRRDIGDWEGDFIVSGKEGKGVLLVLVERVSRYVTIVKLPNRDNDLVNKTIHSLIGGGIFFNSITLDNDIAFSKHEELSRLTGAYVYFCHPYHSWEKGSVENMNKMIRRYIPKSSDISSYTDEFIKEIETKLNNRPRKILNFKTPQEILDERSILKKKVSRVLLKVNRTLSRVS